MDVKPLHPPFGAADLTNCDREFIQLPGSVQPHGVLLILHPQKLHVLQATLNAEAVLGPWGASPLGRSIDSLDPELGDLIRQLRDSDELRTPVPAAATIEYPDGVRRFEATCVRLRTEGIAVELEPEAPDPQCAPGEDVAQRVSRVLTAGLASLNAAPTLQALYDETVRVMRDLAGYDRVMVYKFDPDGHGEVVGEARRDDLESFLGLHYPSSDIPQQARELYLQNRVRVLVDVAYEPAPLFPRLSPISGGDVDMSACTLRSMSPLHLQYLTNMGVRATLVTSLTREERLWGLISCHHYSTRRLPFEVRAACGILSEMVSTRLSALEGMALAQAALTVRRLEQQIVESLATTGDWRTSLFMSPRMLLQAVDASGAALLYENDILTAGNVPSSHDIRAIMAWLESYAPSEPVLVTNALARMAPQFGHLTSSAAGVLAVALSGRGQEFLLWFRPEQVQTVRWGGDPHKPVDPEDPNRLSPRRSFAVWTEVTRATSRPWAEQELATAHSIRSSLVDMVQQVQAVRVLIAQDQLHQVLQAVHTAPEPTIILGADGKVLVVNRAFRALIGPGAPDIESAEDLCGLFSSEAEAETMLTALRAERRLWSAELSLRGEGGHPIPVSIRGEPVPGENGRDLGYVIFATDVRARRDAEAARRRVHDVLRDARQRSISETSDTKTAKDFREMIEAILNSARRALTEMTGDARMAAPGAMASIEALTRRAAALALQLEGYAASRRKR